MQSGKGTAGSKAVPLQSSKQWWVGGLACTITITITITMPMPMPMHSHLHYQRFALPAWWWQACFQLLVIALAITAAHIKSMSCLLARPCLNANRACIRACASRTSSRAAFNWRSFSSRLISLISFNMCVAPMRLVLR